MKWPVQNTVGLFKGQATWWFGNEVIIFFFLNNFFYPSYSNQKYSPSIYKLEFYSVLFSVQSFWVETPGTKTGPARDSTGSEDSPGETNEGYWNQGSKGRWREREMPAYFFTESECFVFLWKNLYQSFWRTTKMMVYEGDIIGVSFLGQTLLVP